MQQWWSRTYHWCNHLHTSAAILVVAPVSVHNCFTVDFFSNLQYASQNTFSKACASWHARVSRNAVYLWGFSCDNLIYEECVAINNAVIWRNQLSHSASPCLYSQKER